MKLKAQFAGVRFDQRAFTKKLDEDMQIAVREAAREFYRIAWEIIPIQTGMAKGTLVPLGRFLRNVPTEITPERKAYKGKSKEKGISAGKTSFRFNNKSGQYSFSFTIPPKVKHYNINESSQQPGVRNASPDGWETVRKGARAFFDRIDETVLKDSIVKAVKTSIKVEVIK